MEIVIEGILVAVEEASRDLADPSERYLLLLLVRLIRRPFATE